MLGFDNNFSFDVNQLMKHEITLCKSYLRQVIYISPEDNAVELREIIEYFNILFG